MARPQKEGLDYFPHDVYASSDEKIEPLLLLYGSKGYAFYFLHLEYVYRNKSFEFDISDAETKQILCQKLQLTLQEYDKILKSSLKKCFDSEYYQKTGKLTSKGIKKRAAVITEKRDKMRVLYGKKVSTAETTPETRQRKVKESKGNDKKNKDLKHMCDIPAEKPKKGGAQSKTGNDDFTDEFEEFWKLYPRNIGKRKAYSVWNQHLKNKVPAENMIKAAKNYSTYCQNNNTETLYIKHAATFLNLKSKPFEEFVTGVPEGMKTFKSSKKPDIPNADNFEQREYDEAHYNDFFNNAGNKRIGECNNVGANIPETKTGKTES